MIILAFFIVVLIVLIAYVLLKILKEQSEIIKKEELENEENSKQEANKVIEVMSEKKFLESLSQAKDDPEKLENLKRTIQDTLRKSVKDKNVYNARICNIQLKRIDSIDKKGNSD